MAPTGGSGGREVLLHEAVVEYAEAERAQSAPSDERVMKAVKLLTAARQLPSRVAGLIWVDSMKRLGTPWTAEQVQAFLEPFRANFVDATRAFVRGMFVPSSDRSLVERVVADISSAPPAVELGAGEYALSYSREIPQVLQGLKLPVVAINADNTPTDVTSMQRYGVEVIFMTGVGHFPMLEDPERFNRLLRTAIGKLIR